MFCPKCGAEYKKGYLDCSDCNINLVKNLPKKPSPKFVEFEKLMFTFSQIDVAFIKSFLDAEKINYYFQGEHFLGIRPLVDPVRLMVQKKDVRKAKIILDSMKLNIMGFKPV